MRSARSGYILMSATLVAALSSACASDETADTPVPVGDASATATPPADGSGGYTAADQGQGSVSFDGVLHEGFAGSCELSRMNGREMVGDLANLEGVKLTVGIDNVKAEQTPEMNFKAYSSLAFSVARGAERTRGTLTGITYESDLTPKGTSQAMAKVAFTGQTDEGVPVVAHVVCEIQNKF